MSSEITSSQNLGFEILFDTGIVVDSSLSSCCCSCCTSCCCSAATATPCDEFFED
ncbi:hypothetical protein [Legionella worsleiensis]|uniref:Uncharacterized protein n=1 Tax=Legionella worsleiensis TaxID=45076 RepID=A0A0W1AL97_9GAMM|nr:hypothetical protein [Legionella worsleiensis]KTD82081.1 hypothetical protein Lwor_0001 [Legionella worsleiensis]STY31503.1 Uncharacterised protein [Legionella worsleiensis]